ncbi:protein-tyrosine-phosphatase [Streptomyces sp. Ru73]|uniref:tyrosine-protein phosphatase n=1 Tax=Streptomyces sp. Ru73 TaxID=2080748 RepID=UPI000CDD0220|nr:tyrosine-protein phosphatase [Streptomyces sp. Ru73]POX42205.1 protein-tyrosine-phosphatase [Streptomyces sp. Ru73]
MRATRPRRTAAVLLTAALGLLPACTAAPADDRPAASSGPATATVHRVPLHGAVNVRDLGGYRTRDGHHVRYGQLFRADGLGGLTAADRGKLAGLGLRTVVDLRIPAEIARDGADRLPRGVAVVSRPVPDSELNDTTNAALGSKDPDRQRKLLGNGRAERLMRATYRSFVSSAPSRRQFAATLRDVADGKGTPLLFHCTAGKDRTGWLSYVLLRALGVPEATATRDYLLSNRLRAAADRRTRAGLAKSGRMRDPELLTPLLEVREDYLRAALDQADREYGGVDGYLTEGLGLDSGTLAALRSRLLR